MSEIKESSESHCAAHWQWLHSNQPLLCKSLSRGHASVEQGKWMSQTTGINLCYYWT